MTALPIEPRVSGEVAATVLERIGTKLRWVPLRAAIYKAAIARCSGRGIRSGGIYDALHLIAAESQAADLLLTFNEADFTRLAEPHGPRIVAPPDPPGLPP